MKTERRLLQAGLVFSVLAHVLLVAWWLRPEAASIRSAAASRARVTHVQLIPFATTTTAPPPRSDPQPPLDGGTEHVRSVQPVQPTVTRAPTAQSHLAESDSSGQHAQLLSESGRASVDEATAFQRALSEHISQYRRYPERARLAGMTGIVEVGFTMDRSGTVLKVWIRRDSGSTVLDGEALSTVWRAQPLPRIPANLPDHLDIFLPISFFLS